jgi:hypothetical protein
LSGEFVLPSYEVARTKAANSQFYRTASKVHLKSDKMTEGEFFEENGSDNLSSPAAYTRTSASGVRFRLLREKKLTGEETDA